MARHGNGQSSSGGTNNAGSFELETPSVKPRGPLRSKTLQNILDRDKAYSDTTSEYTSEEDYDSIEHDPRTVVDGGKGGGFMPRIGSNRIEEDRLGLEGAAAISSQSEEQEPRELVKTQVYRLSHKDTESGAKRMSIDRGKSRTGNRRSKFGDLVFTRRFTTFDRQNSDTADSAFHGFFTLFWLGTAIYMLKIAAENWRLYGSILGTNEIMALMRFDVMVLGLADGVMCGITGFGLLLQRVIYKGYISWNGAGWIIQSMWEVLFLVGVLKWTLIREWPWTHTIFFVLHGLVMLMKQHSFAFYNGHLAEAYRTREILQREFQPLQDIIPVEGLISRDAAMSSSILISKHQTDLNYRPQNSKREPSEAMVQSLQEVPETIDYGLTLDSNKIQALERTTTSEIDALTEDLKGKCTTGRNFYPRNLTLKNHYEFIVLPTLVYELEYPRSEKINWYYVTEKGIAIFGILAIMNLVSQAFIYPVVVQTLEMKESGMPLKTRLKIFPLILSELVFPFMMEYLMTWYVIWECILNLLAELTYFADRGFYSDWWNSVSWDQFARDWNRPVHNFLLRHVYHSSISSLKVNKYTATLITFFLSASVHELVMWCLFKKLRGYLLFLQMMQIPLVQLSRSKWLKGRATLGNLFFWIGIFTGPSLLCSLYLII